MPCRIGGYLRVNHNIPLMLIRTIIMTVVYHPSWNNLHYNMGRKRHERPSSVKDIFEQELVGIPPSLIIHPDNGVTFVD